MSWILILLLLLAVWIGSNVTALVKNYFKARKTGFPLVVCPVNPNNLIWMVTSVPLRGYFKRLLPDALFRRLNMSIYGWEALEKFTPFAQHGQNFMFVTCGNNELNIAEPELAIEVLKRPKDFIQTDAGNFIMRLFGDNLVTSDGESWSRQRKLIAPNINERISKIVFQESYRQATQMMDSYIGNQKGVTDDVINGLKTLAINVLAKAGYGVSWPWKQNGRDLLPGYRMTYIEATRLAVHHIVEASVLPAKLLRLPFMPRTLQNIGHAVREFPVHTKRMLDLEREQSTEENNRRTNLMSILVRESMLDTDGKQGERSASTQPLSESEIVGNLFVFTAAGFDTTANTMAYAVTLLATYPAWQEWLCEELDEVLRYKGEDLEYVEVFPRLTRCLALMYETMRLFTPVVHIAKMSGGHATLTSSNKTYHLPPKTTLYIDASALHTDPNTWGKDALEFRPTRWLATNPDTGMPKLISVSKGEFLPWSAGPRACPGSKMSQVEFVSVFMTIFRRYRVEPMLKMDETLEECRNRLIGLMADSQSRLTLQMNRPREVQLRWLKRYE